MRDRHDIRDPIFLTTFPVSADFFQCFPDNIKLYYCVDDFLNYPGIDHRSWRTLESDLLGCVDGLAVTSKYLAGKRPHGLPLLRLPHGVDFDHFHRPASGFPIPELEQLPRPVVGFFGLLSEWIDIDLLAFLADCFPQVSFLIIGRAEVSLEKIDRKKNIKILNHVPYEDLPRYASYFDVGLIPFVLNELTRAVNPLKLLEYYALGLPVVATRLPELESFPGPIRLADSRESFRAALETTLLSRSPDVHRQAVQVARSNSWHARVNDLLRFINTLERRFRSPAAA